MLCNFSMISYAKYWILLGGMLVTIFSSSLSSSSSASSSSSIYWACTVADHKEDKAQSFWTLELRGDWVDIPWASSACLISLFSFVFISLCACVLTFYMHYFIWSSQQLGERGLLLSAFYGKGNWCLELSNLFEVILTRICVFTTIHFIPFLLSLITLSPLLNWS